MAVTNHYSQAGVDYTKLDHLKVLAQKQAAQTAKYINDTPFSEISTSRGESAYVLEHKTHYLAFVQEGLGTKNLVADEVRKYTGKTHYAAIAQDTVAMITNDLITVGARPLTVMQYLAIGESEWLDDEARLHDLVTGWQKACQKIGATWGGGETPTLKGIIEAKTVDLAGSAVGIVAPKSRLLIGSKIKDGDVIIGLASSGIHANGISLARQIAQKLPQKYQTKLANGQTFGEAILTPSTLYSAVIQNLFQEKIDMHYAVNVTGHGWRKLMRPSEKFCYQIDYLPQPPEIFNFLQTHAQMNDQEMYATFNMGVGFVVYVAAKDADKTLAIAKKNHIPAWQLGTIQHASQSSVVIAPKKISYYSDDLKIRLKK